MKKAEFLFWSDPSLFKKWAIPGLFFFIFVCSIHSWQQTNVQYKYFFANDWIRTADLWYREQLLYQLNHNLCPHGLVFAFCFLNSFMPTYLPLSYLSFLLIFAILLSRESSRKREREVADFENISARKVFNRGGWMYCKFIELAVGPIFKENGN